MTRTLLLSLCALAAGCAGDAGDAQDVATDDSPSPAGGPVVVEERWMSPADTAWDLDTPATWQNGGEAVVLVTGKATHQLHAFDAATGEAVGTIGSPGSGVGEFRRPNGIAVLDDLVFVVERDNRRVQVLSMPGYETVATFGDDVLEYPYGIVIVGESPSPTLWVTDDYEVAPGPDMDVSRRLHRFRLDLDEGGVRVLEHVALGGAAPDGALSVVETIWADPASGLLMVADEAQKSYLGFDDEGMPTGDVIGVGLIEGDPEGLALVECPTGSGYWIATDQRDTVSLFHLFERSNNELVGTFRGAQTANTDGVTFTSGMVPGIGGPAFFAVHDDQSVSAFAWADIAQALGLEEGCGR